LGAEGSRPEICDSRSEFVISRLLFADFFGATISNHPAPPRSRGAIRGHPEMNKKIFESGQSLRSWLFLSSIRNALLAMTWAFAYVVTVVRFSDQQLQILVVSLAAVLSVVIPTVYWLMGALTAAAAADLEAPGASAGE
jgi:hypothetical protein